MQEVELQGRRNTFQLEELRQKQTLEKRQLPKQLKADHKQKVAEVRKAIRNKRAEKESLKKLDEQYVKLCQLETELMNERHEKEMDTVKTELEANMRELQEIQVCWDLSPLDLSILLTHSFHPIPPSTRSLLPLNPSFHSIPPSTRSLLPLDPSFHSIPPST